LSLRTLGLSTKHSLEIAPHLAFTKSTTRLIQLLILITGFGSSELLVIRSTRASLRTLKIVHSIFIAALPMIYWRTMIGNPTFFE
jgi:hypothetical protein